MATDRVASNRERRTTKARGDVVMHGGTTAVTTAPSRNTTLPAHLQPIRENFEAAMAADEAQKYKRLKAHGTIEAITIATSDAVLAVNDKLAESVNVVNETPMRPSQRETVTETLDEVAKIGFAALLDGHEESAIIINEIADTNPLYHKAAPTEIALNLTPTERILGRVNRKV